MQQDPSFRNPERMGYKVLGDNAGWVASMAQDRSEDRHGVQKQGRYRTGNGIARDVMVTDLSTKGCRFFDKFCNLSPGAALTIRIGNIGPLDAEVRWVEDFNVGVQFRTSIHQSVLDHMRTTIEGWHIPEPPDVEPPNLRRSPEHAPMVQHTAAQETFDLTVRPATVADVRQVLLEAGLALPMNSPSELVEVFHRLLDRVARKR